MNTNRFFHLFVALRPKQWTKNAVVLAAFIFALGDRNQQIGFTTFWAGLQAMLLFCVVSSGIYLINDVKDVESDRLHPTKKLRPVAAGHISKQAAIAAGLVLLGVGLTASRLLSPDFFTVVGGYVLLQLFYIFLLKQVALIDSFVIALGFVLRALGGGVAICVPISPWLLLCAFLLALFLALCKRRHEKILINDFAVSTRKALGQYNEQFLDQLIAIVSATTLISYALYTLWPDTVAKFGTTQLGLTIPFVIFGLFRYLDLVYRHEKGDRPEQILLTDIPLLIDLALYGLSVLAILALRKPG